MLVIVSVANLKSGLQVSVERSQHSASATRTYNSVNEARDALLSFGFVEEVLNEYLKLLPEVGTGERLKLPPLDVPHHDLVAGLQARDWMSSPDRVFQATVREYPGESSSNMPGKPIGGDSDS
jgi:hypothetical protein